jgi:hypothetical protein
MTTPHGSAPPEPDDAQRDFVTGTIADGAHTHPGPVFAHAGIAADDPAGTGADSDGADSGGANNDLADDDDGDFAPRPRQRLGLLSGVLVMALAIALGFLGGELVQKHYGTTATAAGAGANRAAAFAGREGAAGAFGANGGFGQAGAGTGTGTGAGTGAGTGTAASPAVIGTVTSIKGMTMIVTNLGGMKVTVHLTSTTTVTLPVAKGALKAGLTVSVVGRTANKVVTATSVVVR